MMFESRQSFIDSGAVYERSAATRGQKHRTDVFSVNGQQFVLKTFRSEKDLARETSAYDVLNMLTDISTPSRHFTDKSSILYDFVPCMSECNPMEAIEDWVEIHARRDLADSFPAERARPEHVDWVVDKVVHGIDVYGPNHMRYAEVIEQGRMVLTHPRNLSLVHGDLHMDNVIHSERGRVYIDLEACGVKDPVADLVPIALYHLKWMDRVVDSYCRKSPFDESQIRESLPVHAVFRGVKLISFHIERKLSEKNMLRARRRILRSLDALVSRLS